MTVPVPSVRAVLVPVGQVARAIDLPEQGLYRRILAIVGGPLERFVSFPLDRAGRSADCWCNEDGLSLQLGPNRLVRLPRFRAAVMGPLVITASAHTDEQACSFRDRELALVLRMIEGWPPLP